MKKLENHFKQTLNISQTDVIALHTVDELTINTVCMMLNILLNIQKMELFF